MPEDHPVPKWYVIAPFFIDDGLELLFFRFGPRSGFSFLGLHLLRVHFVIDFERTGGQHLEERFAVIAYVEMVFVGEEVAIFIVDLEVEVGVSIAGWGYSYDLLVMKVFYF